MDRFGKLVGFNCNPIVYRDRLQSERLSGLLHPIADRAAEFESIAPNKPTQFQSSDRTHPKVVLRLNQHLSRAFAQAR